jgi:prolyl 4-hydroxylase
MFNILLLLSICGFALAIMVLSSSLPDDGPGADARSELFGRDTRAGSALLPPRNSTMPRCPLVDVDTNSGRGGACRFVVRNRHMDNLELIYVDGSSERKYWVLDPWSNYSVDSYTGDKWRLRSRHGWLVREFLTPRCGESAEPLPVIDVEPCAQDDQLVGPPRAPQAPQSIVREFTDLRLRRCGVDRVLSTEAPQPGLHFLCVLPVSALPRAAVSGHPPEVAHAFAVVVFGHGLARGQRRKDGRDEMAAADDGDAPPLHVFLVSPSSLTPESLIELTYRDLERPRRAPQHQPAALFTLSGVRIENAESLRARLASRPKAASPLDPDGLPVGILLFEGGQWLWPAAYLGQVHHVPMGLAPTEQGDVATTSRGTVPSPPPPVRLRVLSLRPRVLRAENFLTDEECAHIVQSAEGHMFTSGVAMKDADAAEGHKADEFRTSSQYSLSPGSTDELLALTRRVQSLTRVPATHTEQIQVLRYQPTQHYSAHHDFFDPGDYSRGGLSRQRGFASNRLTTVFLYLNDVAAGGETNFPRAGGLEQPTDFRACDRGLAARPVKRDVLIFYSMLPSGEFDHFSLHTGCDVGPDAVKWAANYWLWNSPQQSGFLHPALHKLTLELQQEPGVRLGVDAPEALQEDDELQAAPAGAAEPEESFEGEAARGGAAGRAIRSEERHF